MDKVVRMYKDTHCPACGNMAHLDEAREEGKRVLTCCFHCATVYISEGPGPKQCRLMTQDELDLLKQRPEYQKAKDERARIARRICPND